MAFVFRAAPVRAADFDRTSNPALEHVVAEAPSAPVSLMLRPVPAQVGDFDYNAALNRVVADETGTSVLAADGTSQTASAPDSEKTRLCMFCRDYGHLLGEDTVHVFKAPTRWDKSDWTKVGIAAGIVVGTGVLLDNNVNNYVQDHQTSTTRRIADTFAPFGAEGALVVIGGFYAGGAIADDPTAKAVALDGVASSLITSAMILPGLKFIFGRARPHTGKGPDSFSPFQGGSSFPSGHTAEAFAVAATIASHYDSLWIQATAYSVASLVGYARIEQQDHWLSDVVAGGLIGTGVAKAVAALNKKKRGGFAIKPAVGPGHWGVELSASF